MCRITPESVQIFRALQVSIVAFIAILRLCGFAEQTSNEYCAKNAFLKQVAERFFGAFFVAFLRYVIRQKFPSFSIFPSNNKI